MSRKRPMRHHLQQIAGKCNVSAEHLFGSIYREGLLLIRHEDLSVVSNCAQDAFDIMKIGDNADFFDDARVVLLDVSKIGDALEMMLGEWNYLRKGKVTDMCDTKESGWIEATDACDIKEPCKGSPKTPMCNKIKSVCDWLANLVVAKNQLYGDSHSLAGDVLKILYPGGVNPENYVDMLGVVRVLDKLFRIANGADGVDDWSDIAGYGILGVVRRNARSE